MGYGPLLSLTFLAARASQDALAVAKTLLAARADVNAKAQPMDDARYACWAARAHTALFGSSSLVTKTLISLPGGLEKRPVNRKGLFMVLPWFPPAFACLPLFPTMNSRLH